MDEKAMSSRNRFGGATSGCSRGVTLLCFATAFCVAVWLGCAAKTPEQRAIEALAQRTSVGGEDLLEVLLITARSTTTESKDRIKLLTSVAMVYVDEKSHDKAQLLLREAFTLANGPNFDDRLEIARSQFASGYFDDALLSLELDTSPHESSGFRSAATALVVQIALKQVEQEEFASAEQLLSRLPPADADVIREKIQISRILLADDLGAAKKTARQLKIGEARADLLLRIASVEATRIDQLASQETLREAAAGVTSGPAAELLELLTRNESRRQELLPSILSRQVQLKDFDGAFQTLDRFDDAPAAYRSLAEIAIGLAKEGQFDRALALTVLLKGVSPERSRNWATLSKQLHELQEEFEKLGVGQIAESLSMIEHADQSRQSLNKRSPEPGRTLFQFQENDPGPYRSYLLKTKTLHAIADEQERTGHGPAAQATRDRAVAEIATFPVADQCQVLAVLGEMATARGQREPALKLFGRSIEVAAMIDEDESRSVALRAIVSRLCTAGYWETAELTAEQIRGEFERKRALQDLAQLSLEHDRLDDALRIARAHGPALSTVFLAVAAKHAAAGRTDRARELFREALTPKGGHEKVYAGLSIRQVAEQQSKAGLGLDALDTIRQLEELLDRRQATIAVIKHQPAPIKDPAFIRRVIEQIVQEDDAHWREESLLTLARGIKGIQATEKPWNYFK